MKVSHKKRNGRKRSPVPHKSHRNPRAVGGDPVARAVRRQQRRARAEARYRLDDEIDFF